MNYPAKESIMHFLRTKDTINFVSTMRMLQNNYPKAVLDNLMNFLGTHDTGRFYTDIKWIAEDNEEKALLFLKIATSILFLIPGVPCLFYGDEYGIENNDDSSRGCFDWNNYKTKIYSWYLKLSKIRKYKVLKDGLFNILFAKEGKLVFERFNDEERIIFCANLTNTPFNVEIEGDFKSFITKDEINSEICLGENEFEILIEKNKKKKEKFLLFY